MRPLARDEIVPLAAYGSVRDAFRSAVIAHKRARRLAVGPHVTLVFEDRETLRFQVQEMLWVERIAEPDHVATDCPLSALRIQEGLGLAAVHPVVLLRHAYGLPAE